MFFNIDKRLSKYTVGHTNISFVIGYVYIVFFPNPAWHFLHFFYNPLKHVVPLWDDDDEKIIWFCCARKEKIYKIGKRHIVNNDVRKKKKKLLLTSFVLSTSMKRRFFCWNLGNLWFLQHLHTFFLIFSFFLTYYTSLGNIFKWIQMQILIFLSFFVTHFSILSFTWNYISYLNPGKAIPVTVKRVKMLLLREFLLLKWNL